VLFILFGLGIAYAQLRQFDDARRCFGEAIAAVETTKERWSKPRPTRRVAGEIALKSPAPDVAKAQAYLERDARGRTSATGQNLGTPRGGEHGAALARSGQAG
jgi:Flp pilus assembly protein TadD